jgi:hypothetical protein
MEKLVAIGITLAWLGASGFIGFILWPIYDHLVAQAGVHETYILQASIFCARVGFCMLFGLSFTAVREMVAIAFSNNEDVLEVRRPGSHYDDVYFDEY